MQPYNTYIQYNTYECKSYNMSQLLAVFNPNDTLVQLETTEETTNFQRGVRFIC